MSTPLTISLPHQLGRAEARRRIESGFARMVDQLPGFGHAYSERWEGDRLSFSVGALGQKVTGVIEVQDASVLMEIELPGILGVVASSLKDRLRKAGQLLLTRDK